MPDTSSYLRYLPPVLWENDPPPPEFSLGGMLRIFEKLLTGLDDAEVILHGEHEHEPVEAVIARVHRLFDPWATPPEFLEWLASWLSLRFPAIWDEYERRKVTAEIVQIYRRRGLKAGLEQYLDLYTVQAKRPRIVLDDGSRILFADPEPDRFVSLSALISHGPGVRFDRPTKSYLQFHEGIVAPLCLARGPDGSLFAGDQGTPALWTPAVGKRVWRLPPPGRYPFRGAPPRPFPVGPAGWNLQFPVAVATDQAAPWRLWVLDRVINPAATALWSLDSPTFAVNNAVATRLQLGYTWPVAMALDTNGHLLILDRGAPPAVAAAPRIIDVQVAPLVVTSQALVDVLEPFSLLVLPDGDLLIGDGREQNAPTPADLVRVDRTGPGWVETRLLSTLPAGANPLVAPAALVLGENADEVYVADTGLKPLTTSPLDPYIRVTAELPAVYRVRLASPTTVTRATETRQMVFPTGMVRDGGTLYVSDRGEYSDPLFAGAIMQVWRARPHQFGVVVHFSSQRPTTALERKRIVQNIHEIVSAESPAQSQPTLVYSV